MENAGLSLKGTRKPKGLGGKRGAGVPGYLVLGCGKHGVSVENTGCKCKTRGTIISPNNEVEILLFQIATKNNRRETRFLVFGHKTELILKHLVRKKTIQMPTCHAMVLFCMGRLFYVSQ